MQRRLTCPHCENGIRLYYLVRKHLVDVAAEIHCPHCRAALPNPGPLDAAQAPFCAVRIVAEHDERRDAWDHGIRWCLAQAGSFTLRHPEWVVTGATALVLLVCLCSGRQLSDEAIFSGFVFLPFLVLSVSGMQQIRVRRSAQPTFLQSVLQAAGMLSAGMLLLFAAFTVAGR